MHHKPGFMEVSCLCNEKDDVFYRMVISKTIAFSIYQTCKVAWISGKYKYIN